MKKVLLVLAVATVFVACESKKKEEEKVPTPGPDTTKVITPGNDTQKIVVPNPADTGKKTAMENGKDAIKQGGEAVSAVKEGDMKTAGEKGNGAVESAKKAVAH